MCAQFMIRASAKKIAAKLGIAIRDEDIEWNERFLPHGRAPVIVRDGDACRLKLMQFSLLPAWSREKKVKFATHNARLLSHDEKTGKDVAIYEKPTWKNAFLSRRCLVPMTHFIEPIYHGTMAGNMVSFHRTDDGVLLAAGLWEEWVSQKDGEVIDSFTIITDDPIPFVKKIGHDRSPLFLDSGAYGAWLEPGRKEPAALMKLLAGHKEAPELGVETDRPLKAGWEKRA